MKVKNSAFSSYRVELTKHNIKELLEGKTIGTLERKTIGTSVAITLKKMTLEEKYKDAMEMINQVYEIIEVWNASAINTDYNKKIKKEWLRKAREIHGADPMP